MWSFALAAILFLLAFLRTFDWHEPQWTDATWFAALFSWVGAVLARARPTGDDLPWRRADFLVLAVLLPIFAVCWLPFYDNWRWAFTGDSFGIYSAGYWLGKDGPVDSILSVHGIDNFYTRLWEVSYSWLMYVVEPTLFWHRVGQLLMACAALAAIHTFFTVLLGRWWSALIVVATATNYIFVWISYISYQRTDSFVFYYLTLTGALLLWRNPGRTGAWLLCGLVGGLSLLYTPVVWGAVAWVAVIFGTIAVVQRRFGALMVYALSFALAALPMLLEIPWMIDMLQTQAVARGAGNEQTLPSLDYLWRMFSIILWSPYDSPIHELGAAGAFLRFPLGHLYLAGIALAAVAVFAPIRRALRVPGAASVLLGLLISDAVLFALTNKGYGMPSHKRFYNLIPLQTFFAVLPLYVASRWGTAREARAVVFAVGFVCVGVAAAIGFERIAHPEPNLYGHNVFDGLIEMRQRYPDREIVLFSTRPLAEPLDKEGLFHLTYGIGENLELVAQLRREDLDKRCRADVLFCYEVNSVRTQAESLLDADPRWRPVQVLNSFELRCARCVP